MKTITFAVLNLMISVISLINDFLNRDSHDYVTQCWQHSWAFPTYSPFNQLMIVIFIFHVFWIDCHWIWCILVAKRLIIWWFFFLLSLHSIWNSCRFCHGRLNHPLPYLYNIRIAETKFSLIVSTADNIIRWFDRFKFFGKHMLWFLKRSFFIE